MLWINAIDMAGYHDAKNNAITLVSNRHTAIENYQYWTMRQALQSGQLNHPALAALRDRSHDPALPWRDKTLRDELSRESHDRADALDKALEQTLPARVVSDPKYQMDVTEPKINLAELVGRGPATARSDLEAMLASLLARCGAYSRMFVLDLLAGGK